LRHAAADRQTDRHRTYTVLIPFTKTQLQARVNALQGRTRPGGRLLSI